MLKRVALWASPEAVDIAGCDAALVAQLVQCGLVRDTAEFYRLKRAEIVLLEGVDETKSRLLWDAIKASKQREAWRVLFGLHIPNIGAAEARGVVQARRVAGRFIRDGTRAVVEAGGRDGSHGD